MRALVQRVSEARVLVAGETVGAIGQGLLVLFCAETGDGEAELAWMIKKIPALRIFEDEAGRMNLDLAASGGAVLAVSQFTLAADLSRGNRPGFSRAAAPELAEDLYDRFCAGLRHAGLAVETGRFGTKMAVHLVNDGPTTLWLDTKDAVRRA